MIYSWQRWLTFALETRQTNETSLPFGSATNVHLRNDWKQRNRSTNTNRTCTISRFSPQKSPTKRQKTIAIILFFLLLLLLLSVFRHHRKIENNENAEKAGKEEKNCIFFLRLQRDSPQCLTHFTENATNEKISAISFCSFQFEIGIRCSDNSIESWLRWTGWNSRFSADIWIRTSIRNRSLCVAVVLEIRRCAKCCSR